METRKCIVCNKRKPIAEFYTIKINRKCVTQRCSECANKLYQRRARLKRMQLRAHKALQQAPYRAALRLLAEDEVLFEFVVKHNAARFSHLLKEEQAKVLLEDRNAALKHNTRTKATKAERKADYDNIIAELMKNMPEPQILRDIRQELGLMV